MNREEIVRYEMCGQYGSEDATVKFYSCTGALMLELDRHSAIAKTLIDSVDYFNRIESD